MALNPVAAAPPRELGYAEVTSTQTTTSGTMADVTGWTVTVTVGSRPIVVIALPTVTPTNNTADNGAKYQLVRTDTSTTIASASGIGRVANQGIDLPPLIRRLSLTAGTTITFKVQTGAVVGGTASFGASSDLPLTIRVSEV